MKNILTYLGFLYAAVFFTACNPAEDRLDIDGMVTKTGNEFSFTQTTGYNNQLICKLNTDKAVAFWEVCRYSNKVKLLSGNLRVDTLVLPFQGDYLVRAYAYCNGGVIIDSVKITTTQADPKYFSNPYWALLTNGVSGRYWKLSKKYLGPESNYHSNWYQPDISTNSWANDSIYFDLNFAFSFKHFSKGTVSSTTFSLVTDKFTYAPVMISLGESYMPDNDASDVSSAGNTKNFRIYRCTTDSLVVGQGASLTASRTSEDWGWFWVFLRK